MIPSEPLNTSSALAPAEINPNKQCEQCKEAVGGRSQATVQSLYYKQLLLSRFKIHFAATCKGIGKTKISRFERNVAVSICSDLQNTGKRTWGAQSLQWLQKTRTQENRFKILENHMPCATSPYWSRGSLAQQRAVSQGRKKKKIHMKTN